MSIAFIDLLIEEKKERDKYWQNYSQWLGVIQKEATRVLGKVKIFLFGSFVAGKPTGGSDIDILIISPVVKDPLVRSKAYLALDRKLGPSSPFEIHLITPKDYQNWYRFFLKEKKAVMSS